MNWPTIALADACTRITDGTHLTPKFEQDGVPFLFVSNIVENRICFKKTKFISEATHEELTKRCPIKIGDVLYTIVGSYGNPAVVREDRPFAFQRHIAHLKPDHNRILSDYLWAILDSNLVRQQVEKLVRGVAQKTLNLSQLRTIEIPLPPLPEQRRIADILDRAEALRAKRRAAIAKLETMTQAIFVEMFGDPVTNPRNWPRRKLGSSTVKIGSGSTPTGGETAYQLHGISLIRSLNVRDGEFAWKDLAHIDDDQADKLSNVVVSQGDVLLNITGASVARVCLAPAAALPARVNQHVMIIRPSEVLLAPFLEQTLLNSGTKRNLLRISEAGATRQAITKAQIEELELIHPPIDTQAKFCRHAEVTKKLKSAHRQSLAKLDDLFASLQHRAFRGGNPSAR